jgi:hypothetical protein
MLSDLTKVTKVSDVNAPVPVAPSGTSAQLSQLGFDDDDQQKQPVAKQRRRRINKKRPVSVLYGPDGHGHGPTRVLRTSDDGGLPKDVESQNSIRTVIPIQGGVPDDGPDDGDDESGGNEDEGGGSGDDGDEGGGSDDDGRSGDGNSGGEEEEDDSGGTIVAVEGKVRFGVQIKLQRLRAKFHRLQTLERRARSSRSKVKKTLMAASKDRKRLRRHVQYLNTKLEITTADLAKELSSKRDADFKRGRQGERFFSVRGGMTLALKRSFANAAACTVGRTLGVDVHHTTVSRWEVKLRACQLNSMRTWMKQQHQMLEMKSLSCPRVRVSIKCMRSDATNSKVWQEVKLNMTLLDAKFLTDAVDPKTPWDGAHGQKRDVESRSIMAELQVLQDKEHAKIKGGMHLLGMLEKQAISGGFAKFGNGGELPLWRDRVPIVSAIEDARVEQMQSAQTLAIANAGDAPDESAAAAPDTPPVLMPADIMSHVKTWTTYGGSVGPSVPPESEEPAPNKPDDDLFAEERLCFPVSF